MQIAVVDSPERLASEPTDIVVLPERVTWEQVMETQRARPLAIVVGAVLENLLIARDPHGRPCCRAVALHRGRNWVDYLKVGDDGTSTGVGREPAVLPIYRHHDLVLGVLICMDLDLPLASRVISDLRASQVPKKLLCVPAAMTASGSWTFNSQTAARYGDIHFTVSNRSDLGDPDHSRIKSLYRDPATKQFTLQICTRPLLFSI